MRDKKSDLATQLPARISASRNFAATRDTRQRLKFIFDAMFRMWCASGDVHGNAAPWARGPFINTESELILLGLIHGHLFAVRRERDRSLCHRCRSLVILDDIVFYHCVCVLVCSKVNIPNNRQCPNLTESESRRRGALRLW
jgi:hypothetical protein